MASGAIATLMGIRHRSIPGLLVAGAGAALLYHGYTGRPIIGRPLGADAEGDDVDGGGVLGLMPGQQRGLFARGVQIIQAITVRKSPEELYRFWRNFENLPRIMTHLESVRQLDERRSHWVAKSQAPTKPRMEWDAEITQDEPNRRIAWRSLPGADVDNRGSVRFEPAPGDRGTEVHVEMVYVPPAGRIGHWIASMMGDNPKRVVREDLRNFKRLMELGEIPSIIGQSHGTCTGQGERYTETAWRPLFT